MTEIELVEKIEKIVELLYQQNVGDASQKLLEILPAISDVAEIFIKETNDFSILESLKICVEAMENADNTLLADVLQYEIAEKIKEFI